jgi:hypothetical protein
MSSMVTDDVFGPIFDGSVLTRAVLATLKMWFPTYIREIEFQRGYTVGDIQAPKTYAERWRFDSYPDDKMPAVIVVSPGMASPPVKDGDGTVNGWWALGIGIIAAASTEENSERLAKVYGAAARLIMSQKGWLDETWEFNGTQIIDETYIDVPDMEQSRTMRSAQIIAEVQVLNMWNLLDGPSAPTDPPGSQWLEVEEVFIDDIKRIEEE